LRGPSQSLLARVQRSTQRGEGPDLVGQIVDRRFRVVSLIGSGGMADVYEVEHVTLGRRLALKVLRQTQESSPALVRRFSREARALSRIASEHVVSIFDYGVLPGGFPFFIMELLRGESLRSVLEAQQRLPVTRVCNLVIDVCLGLHAAHAVGCVHRDLKPENLWLTRRDDGREACILLDFGVARLDDTRTTTDGVLVGTTRYMSPEQIRSDAVLGPESDVFALGVIAYECLCGKSPFAADTVERTLFRVLNEQPRPVTELAREVAPELSLALERALHKQRSERFGSALHMARAFLRFASAQRQLPLSELGRPVTPAGDASTDTEPLGPAEVRIDSESAAEGSTVRAGFRSSWWFVLIAFAVGLGVLPLTSWQARGSRGVTQRASSAPTPPALTTSPISREAEASHSLASPAPPAVSASAPDQQKLAPAETTSFPPSSGSHVTRVGTRQASPRASASSPVLTDTASLRSAKSERGGPPQPTFDGSNPYQP
jgi:eukaryotic-like serine/threonine-protein kinase